MGHQTQSQKVTKVIGAFGIALTITASLFLLFVTLMRKGFMDSPTESSSHNWLYLLAAALALFACVISVHAMYVTWLKRSSKWDAYC